MTTYIPRPKQKEVLAYTGGYMGVSAVPGSGKTHTLSALAAKLVAEAVEEDEEVLIVTFANSAVDNFVARIRDAVKALGLMPGLGYRVRTLHGLAHDIVRDRPALVGLSEDFHIIDDRETDQVRRQVTAAWLGAHPHVAETYLRSDLEGRRQERVLRDDWPALAQEVAATFIKRAKDYRYRPEQILKALERASADFPLARLGAEVYQEYQKSLAYRAAVDFDDLIRLALDALHADADYLARLQAQWPYILEDEAQDSSKLQEDILRLLAGPGGNWVRVGDPNQAIYETFTNADPRFLRNFLTEADVARRELPNSGRSTQSIMDLANHLVDWTVAHHPLDSAHGAFLPQHILPTPPDDPQPNPPDDPTAIHLFARELSPSEEVKVVADSLANWLPQHPEETVAVLVPRNERGVDLVDALKKRGLPYVELLRSTAPTRSIAGVLGTVLDALAHPDSARKLAAAYQAWRRADREDEEKKARLAQIVKLIQSCPRVEDYLWPRLERDWLSSLPPLPLPPGEGEGGRGGEGEVPLDTFLTLLFDQVLSRLGFGFHRDLDNAAVAARLIESVRKFRQAVPQETLPGERSVGQEYLYMVEQGVLAATSLVEAWRGGEGETGESEGAGGRRRWGAREQQTNKPTNQQIPNRKSVPSLPTCAMPSD